MKFYGVGALMYPGTKRVVHDFEDGPFTTYNPEIIRHALAMGCVTEEPQPEIKVETVEEIKAEIKAEVSEAVFQLVTPEPEIIRRKPGRPPKERKDADEKPSSEEKTLGDESEVSEEIRGGDSERQEIAEEKEGE